MQFEQPFFNQKASIHIFGWSWLQADLAAGRHWNLPFSPHFLLVHVFGYTVSVLSCKYPICRCFRLQQVVWTLQFNLGYEFDFCPIT